MIGEKLRNIRKSKNLSLDTVHQHTGITDSKLSKIETGKTQNLSLDDLCSLLRFYEVPLVSFLFDEGYIKTKNNIFENTELLNDFEIEHIQHEIDFILKEKGITNG